MAQPCLAQVQGRGWQGAVHSRDVDDALEGCSASWLSSLGSVKHRHYDAGLRAVKLATSDPSAPMHRPECGMETSRATMECAPRVASACLLATRRQEW